MRSIRKEERVATELAVLLREDGGTRKLSASQLSANSLVLEGTAGDRFLESKPLQVLIALPGGCNVEAWIEHVRFLGDDAAFRLRGVEDAGRQALLEHVSAVERRTATLH